MVPHQPTVPLIYKPAAVRQVTVRVGNTNTSGYITDPAGWAYDELFVEEWVASREFKHLTGMPEVSWLPDLLMIDGFRGCN